MPDPGHFLDMDETHERGARISKWAAWVFVLVTLLTALSVMLEGPTGLRWVTLGSSLVTAVCFFAVSRQLRAEGRNSGA